MHKLAFISRTLVKLGIAQISNKKEQAMSRLLLFIPIILSILTTIFFLIAFFVYLKDNFSDVAANLIFAVLFLALTIVAWLSISLHLRTLQKKKEQHSQDIDKIIKSIVQSYSENSETITKISGKVLSKRGAKTALATLAVGLVVGYLGLNKNK